MPLILPANTLADTGYVVANSCRFASGDTAYMHRTLGTATNEKKFTFSAWIKRGLLSGDQTIFNVGPDSSAEWQTGIRLRAPSDYDIHCTFDDRGTATQLITTPEYRDPTGWMHIVFAVDTTQSTAANRMKLYVNGVQQNDDNTYVNVYPSQDTDCDAMDSGNTIAVGRRTSSTNMYFDGYMAEVCFVDGTAYAASDFGEYDEDSPAIWKPKDVSELTFGNNGFYLDFEDSGNLGDDESGNGNDLTEVNLAAADQAQDSPTNNFCVLNPLDNFWIHSTFSQGNCQIVTDSSDYAWNTGTIAASKGKWYYECKVSEACNTTETLIGISSFHTTSATAALGATVDAYGYYGAGHIRTNNGNAISSLSTYTAGDIISVAFDLDNNKFYVRKNGGSWENSGDPESGSTGTGAQSITASGSQTVANNIGGYFPAVGDYDSTDGGTFQLNFGGCSAFSVSSGNADANGYGNFEYSVPNSYYSLCTKNLAEFG